jgi:putative transposase
MPQYVRVFVPGGTFFFTVTLLERRRKFLTKTYSSFHRYVALDIDNLEWAADDNVRN